MSSIKYKSLSPTKPLNVRTLFATTSAEIKQEGERVSIPTFEPLSVETYLQAIPEIPPLALMVIGPIPMNSKLVGWLRHFKCQLKILYPSHFIPYTLELKPETDSDIHFYYILHTIIKYCDSENLNYESFLNAGFETPRELIDNLDQLAVEGLRASKLIDCLNFPDFHPLVTKSVLKFMTKVMELKRLDSSLRTDKLIAVDLSQHANHHFIRRVAEIYLEEIEVSGDFLNFFVTCILVEIDAQTEMPEEIRNELKEKLEARFHEIQEAELTTSSKYEEEPPPLDIEQAPLGVLSPRASRLHNPFVIGTGSIGESRTTSPNTESIFDNDTTFMVSFNYHNRQNKSDDQQNNVSFLVPVSQPDSVQDHSAAPTHLTINQKVPTGDYVIENAGCTPANSREVFNTYNVTNQDFTSSLETYSSVLSRSVQEQRFFRDYKSSQRSRLREQKEKENLTRQNSLSSKLRIKRIFGRGIQEHNSKKKNKGGVIDPESVLNVSRESC